MANIAESVGAVNKWSHQLYFESKHITIKIHRTQKAPLRSAFRRR